MDRKEFLSRFGQGAASLIIPLCLGGLASCKKQDSPVDFTVDISSGALSSNGGFLVKNNVLIARSNSGDFIAVSSACTHEGTTVNYVAANNDFVCPNHGAKFDSNGAVVQGPASQSLKKYNTTVSGNTLRVFS